MSDQVRAIVRRGHRTSNGQSLRVVWTPVAELKPGDVLAGLRVGNDRSTATAELVRALQTRTYANVETVDTEHDVTRVTITTRMGSKLDRSWRNAAYLPVLHLVSTSENLSASRDIP